MTIIIFTMLQLGFVMSLQTLQSKAHGKINVYRESTHNSQVKDWLMVLTIIWLTLEWQSTCAYRINNPLLFKKKQLVQLEINEKGKYIDFTCQGLPKLCGVLYRAWLFTIRYSKQGYMSTRLNSSLLSYDRNHKLVNRYVVSSCDMRIGLFTVSWFSLFSFVNPALDI